jgi:NADH:ubiquinone oxidoreductase subunit 2 (subunit N)
LFSNKSKTSVLPLVAPMFGFKEFDNIVLNQVETYSDFFMLLPEISFVLLICLALVFLSIELGRGPATKELSLKCLILVRNGLLVIIVLYIAQLVTGITNNLFITHFIVNKYTTALKLLTTVSGLFVLHNSEEYVRTHSRKLVEYPIMLALALLLMVLLISSGHIISAFIALIGFSLNVYVLILFDAPHTIGREAGVKYFYLSTFSSGLVLYGFVLLFILTGTGYFAEISVILSFASELVNTGKDLLTISISFILVGLLFKLSAFPGHL